MSPIKIDTVISKKTMILREIGFLNQLLKENITSKSDLRDQHALCHSVQTLISAVIDIAQHIVSEKTESIPQTYYEAIELLALAGALDDKFAHEYAQVAKLRNVVVVPMPI